MSKKIMNSKDWYQIHKLAGKDIIDILDGLKQGTSDYTQVAQDIRDHCKVAFELGYKKAMGADDNHVR